MVGTPDGYWRIGRSNWTDGTLLTGEMGNEVGELLNEQEAKSSSVFNLACNFVGAARKQLLKMHQFEPIICTSIEEKMPCLN